MATINEKLKNCEVCGESRAKYTCPKCEVRTCNLKCINIHKKELNCDGIRDKTKYIPMKAFTDLDLLSDYRLLEKVSRSVEQLQSDKSKRFTRMHNLPSGLYKLKQAAYRKNIRLELLPHNFSRNKENTTFYDWKTKEFFWRVEWIFPQAENIRWVTERAVDTTRLSDLLENTLESNDDNPEIQRQFQQKLDFYRSAGLPGLKVYLKAERVQKSSCKFYELDYTLDLKENFARKTIIEFPTIYVVLRDHSDCYEIVDTDEEEEQRKSEKIQINNDNRRPTRLDNFVENKPKKKKDKTSPVNFFFDEASSDSEQEIQTSQHKNNKKSTQLNIPVYDNLINM